jgi:hypothetical protein
MNPVVFVGREVDQPQPERHRHSNTCPHQKPSHEHPSAGLPLLAGTNLRPSDLMGTVPLRSPPRRASRGKGIAYCLNDSRFRSNARS